MPKLHSSDRIVSVLERHHFLFVSQKGSHIKLQKRIGRKKLTVIVPANRKEIPAGTFSSILRQAQLSKEDFE